MRDESPQLSIDISCPQGTQQRTGRPPLLLLFIDGTDTRTNGRTMDRCVDPAPHTMRTVSVGLIDSFYPRDAMLARV